MTIQGNGKMAASDRSSPSANRKTSNIVIKGNEQVAILDASISILAPMNMPGGYEFFADAGNGSSYKVRVSAGGVTAGERFDAIIVQQASDAGTGSGHNIPTGHWRDGLCDCCAFGCCHPVCCLGYCFHLCLLGQVLTRNKLSCIGLPTGKVEHEPCSYQFWFAMVVVIFVIKVGMVWMVVLTLVSLEEDIDDDCVSYRYSRHCTTTYTYEYTGPKWAIACLALFWLFLLIISILECIATCKARESLRNKYRIEGGCCEDCCCAICCPICTLCQLARHTADYRVDQAYCCTATGLSLQAPEVV